MLEGFPVAVRPVMELAAGVVVMGTSHCDFLELALQLFNEGLKEDLESVRFSEIQPCCVRGAHGDGFHGNGLLCLWSLFGREVELKESRMGSEEYLGQNGS
jgi:hypothetical protein